MKIGSDVALNIKVNILINTLKKKDEATTT